VHIQQQLEPVLGLCEKPLGGFNWQPSAGASVEQMNLVNDELTE
jgi:hypothetical protein